MLALKEKDKGWAAVLGVWWTCLIFSRYRVGVPVAPHMFHATPPASSQLQQSLCRCVGKMSIQMHAGILLSCCCNPTPRHSASRSACIPPPVDWNLNWLRSVMPFRPTVAPLYPRAPATFRESFPGHVGISASRESGWCRSPTAASQISANRTAPLGITWSSAL